MYFHWIDSSVFLFYAARLFTTIGVHPTRCNAFEEFDDPDEYLKSMTALASNNRDKIVAIGEMGLDYDRLNFCSKDTQKKYFEMQLTLCSTLELPMFLHCRNASEDFVNILRKYKGELTEGVVHSFDGNPEEANSLLQLGLYIGINGWFVIFIVYSLVHWPLHIQNYSKLTSNLYFTAMMPQR